MHEKEQPKPKHNCINCKYSSNTETELKQHIKMFHVKRDPGITEIRDDKKEHDNKNKPNQEYITQERQDEDQDSENKDPAFPCTHCRHNTKNLDDLKRHITKFHERQIRIKKIAVIPKDVNSEINVKHVKKKGKEDDIEEYLEEDDKSQVGSTCEHCDYITTSSLDLIKHMQKDHKLKFPCEHCGKQLGTQRALWEHRRNKHEINNIKNSPKITPRIKMSRMKRNSKIPSTLKKKNLRITPFRTHVQKTLLSSTCKVDQAKNKLFHDSDPTNDYDKNKILPRILDTSSIQQEISSKSLPSQENTLTKGDNPNNCTLDTDTSVTPFDPGARIKICLWGGRR
jgi:hypothetical protein